MNRNILLIVALWCSVFPAMAGLEGFDFTGNVQEERFKTLIAEVRCLVCQNQSLSDSDAELANDLRVEVYELMQQGKSDTEIVDFLVARYGDFVLYSPPVKPSTYFLWYGPFVLLALGLLVLVRNVRQRGQQLDTSLSEQEQARLDALIGESSEDNKKEQDR